MTYPTLYAAYGMPNIICWSLTLDHQNQRSNSNSRLLIKRVQWTLKTNSCTYGSKIRCKMLSISLLLTDRFKFMLPAGFTVEKYVLKHCSGLPLHGPTENHFYRSVCGIWYAKTVHMILEISNVLPMYRIPHVLYSDKRIGVHFLSNPSSFLRWIFCGLPSGIRATDIVATFNNNFNIFSI